MVVLVSLLVGCGWFSAPAVCEPPGTQVEQPRAAGCVVVRDHQLLMVQGTNGRWSIPAGMVEEGEGGASAASRETREEAGVDAVAGEPVCAVPSHGFVAYACQASPEAVPVPDGVETQDARFVGRQELSSLWLRFPAQRDTYRRALEGR